MNNVKVNKSGFFHLSESQLDYWFLYRFKNNQYLLSYEYDFVGSLELDVLEEASSFVVNRHEALWVRPHKYRLLQRKDKPKEFKLRFWDLDGVDVDEKENQIERINEMICEMDFFRLVPSCLIGVIRYSSNRHILFFVSPHFNVDATSIGLIVDEVLNVYRLKLAGLSNSEIESKTAYQLSDYISYEMKRRADQSKYKKTLDYALRSYKEIQPLYLSENSFCDKSGDNYDNTEGVIKGEELARLREILSIYNVSTYLGWVAIVYLAVHKCTNKENFSLSALFNDRVNHRMKSLVAPAYREVYFNANGDTLRGFSQIIQKMKSQFDHSFKNTSCEECIPLYCLEKNKWLTWRRPLFMIISLVALLLSKMKFNATNFNFRVLAYYLSYFSFPYLRKVESKFLRSLGLKKKESPVDLEVNYFDKGAKSSNDFENTDSLGEEGWFDFDKSGSYSGLPYIAINLEEYPERLLFEIEGIDISEKFKQRIVTSIKSQVDSIIRNNK